MLRSGQGAQRSLSFSASTTIHSRGFKNELILAFCCHRMIGACASRVGSNSALLSNLDLCEVKPGHFSVWYLI